SALIHAATMVTSGIYLIARMGSLYLQAPQVMVLVSVIGGLTAIIAAFTAIAQNDIKKVLAYSTVSQLGFMFMALGAGAFSTAIFHVMTHAFFKACLFLGSGSVIHAMHHAHAAHDPQDIRTMGSLSKYMPHTSKTFWISTFAIAGLPPLSGFFSKDEILGKLFANGHESFWYYLVWLVGCITAFLTAFYMTRVTYLTFEGKCRFENHDHHPHESPAIITIPLWILAILAIIGGFFGLPEIIGHGHYNWITNHWLARETAPLLQNRKVHAELLTEIFLIVSSVLIGLAGVIISFRLYKTHDLAGDEKVKNFFGGFYEVMKNKFYFDEIYNKYFIHPFVYVSENVVYWFDKTIVDGAVNGAGWITLFVGDFIKRIQTGIVQTYAVIMMIGVLVMIAYLMM
ncbi:MAG: NADH-quinone oxidoreductase subunit L, partial [Bacteroidia bacterium]|nr:NADH-quinone oxidoreductase subunit L [Bacteroidia bacterium]